MQPEKSLLQCGLRLLAKRRGGSGGFQNHHEVQSAAGSEVVGHAAAVGRTSFLQT
jgi:hypothetical protein